MSYIALARKWRPRTFSQLIGQDAINKALTQALQRQKLHHAYLFTGTRGVGKTSLARLMAKAMSCEKNISAEPCLTCDTCQAIEKGQFVDLFEIDAASRTRVEDTRDILDNVQYLPTLGRFKIYIIDEVHMLSTHSFNALLKTLEEPPAHVKFILATTDPQKLPATILSRCLQFHLKPMQPTVIVTQLQTILQAEACTYEQEALLLLAQAAQGSLRDALSLLDQALAYTETHLTASEVKALLGYTQQNYALQLLQALAALQPDQMIKICRQIAAEGGHFRYVLDSLLSLLHQLAVAQSVKNSVPLLSLDDSVRPLLDQFTSEEIQLFYQIGLNGLQDMPLAPSLDMGFEMTLLRMYAFKPAEPAAPPVLAADFKATSNAKSTMTKTAASYTQENIDFVAPLDKIALDKTTDVPSNLSSMAQTASSTAERPNELARTEVITIPLTPENALSNDSMLSDEPIEQSMQDLPEHENSTPIEPPLSLTSAIEPRHVHVELGEEKRLVQTVHHNEEQTLPMRETVTAQLPWDKLLQKLGLTGLAQSAAEQATWGGKSESVVTLCIDKNHQSIFTPSIKTRIEQALSSYYQETIRLQLSIHTSSEQPTPAQQKTILQQQRQEDAQQALVTDPVFQALQETFEGHWVGQALNQNSKD